MKAYFINLKKNKKLQRLHWIGIIIFLINLLINFLRALNHHYHFFYPEANTVTQVLYHTINHPAFIFFEHAWIEIFSAILIYFLLEDKFKDVDKIPEHADERDHEKILEQFSSNAKERIRILDTSIDSFIRNYELFKNSLIKALDKKNLKIEILLLHPDTYAAEQRSRDLTFETRSMLEHMKLGLGRLHKFIDGLDEQKKNRIKVKLFKTTPMMIFASWDDVANFGLLHPNNIADDKDTFLVKVDTPLVRSFNNYFDDLWSEENYKNKKTVFLNEYLFVKIFYKNHTIPGLYWGGENENRELPKYIIDLNNQLHLQELINLSTNNNTVSIIHDNTSTLGRIKLIESKIDSTKTKYAKEQIKKTFGNELDDFNNFIFQVEYLYDTQIKLANRNFVKEKLDVKGYAFVSHNQYDVILGPLVRDTLEHLKKCFDKYLDIDRYDSEAIKKIKSKYPEFSTNPRKRLLAIHNCTVENGFVQVTPYLKDSKYKYGYKISYKDIHYQTDHREFTTLHQLLERNKSEPDEELLSCLKTIQAFIKSSITSDIIYILGANNLNQTNRSFKVYTHLIRTWVSEQSGNSITAFPTPQTDQSTLCDYQVIHLVRRENIVGGINEITIGPDSPNRIKDYLLLENPLDSVFFKKRIKIKKKHLSIKHHTGEIHLAPKSRTKYDNDADWGFRDVLVIEYVGESIW